MHSDNIYSKVKDLEKLTASDVRVLRPSISTPRYLSSRAMSFKVWSPL